MVLANNAETNSAIGKYVQDIAEGPHYNQADALERGVLSNTPVLEGIVIACIRFAESADDNGCPSGCRRGWQQALSDRQRDR